MSRAEERETCLSCRWWQPTHERSGECRGGLPQIDYRNSIAIGVWPTSSASEWCREWTPMPGKSE